MSLSLQLAQLPDGRKAAIIRTSDRIAFKQCRRKWGFSSHMKMNLGPRKLAAPLWFGSAIHYALEDFHGYNKFGRASKAFKAYCLATTKNYIRDLPDDAKEHYELGEAMMDYYEDMWLKQYGRKPDETYWIEDPATGERIPQVEVNFEIEIPIWNGDHPKLEAYCKAQGIDAVLYRGTIDRVAIDSFGALWIVEYKTAKVFQNTHFATDPQVTTYVWAASLIYDRPVAGVVYHQFIKKYPQGPRLLSSGGISTAQNQVTSCTLYENALVNLYGDVRKAPSTNQAFLTQLMKAETEDRDRYIIRERIHRSPAQCQHESWKIMMELEDMLNPDLPLYPNPTRDCARMCSFVTPCVNMDDNADWEQLLGTVYASRDQDPDRMWRRRLPGPGDLMLDIPAESPDAPDLFSMQLESIMASRTPEDAEADKLAQIAAGDYDAPEWQSDPDPFGGMDEKGRFNMADVQDR